MMGLNSKLLPDSFKRRMANAVRKTLGQAGMTLEEHAEKNEWKNEREFHEKLGQYLQMKGVRTLVHSRMDRPSTNQAGTPDFLFVYLGVPCAWELKLPGKNPEPHQIQCMDDMIKDGWSVHVVRSIGQAVEILSQIENRTTQ